MGIVRDVMNTLKSPSLICSGTTNRGIERSCFNEHGVMYKCMEYTHKAIVKWDRLEDAYFEYCINTGRPMRRFQDSLSITMIDLLDEDLYKSLSKVFGLKVNINIKGD